MVLQEFSFASDERGYRMPSDEHISALRICNCSIDLISAIDIEASVLYLVLYLVLYCKA